MLEGSRVEGRILCAQNGTAVAERLRPLLTDFEIVTATTGSAVLDQARDGLFDLYVLADRLPDGRGSTFSREIRKFDPHTPVVLCFTNGGELSHPPLDRVDAQGYITEPIDAFATEHVLRNLLGLARERSIEARVAELHAISDEVAERLRNMQRDLAGVSNSLLLAHDALIMSRAYAAFAAGGGMRADFRRMWPAVLKEACDSAQ